MQVCSDVTPTFVTSYLLTGNYVILKGRFPEVFWVRSVTIILRRTRYELWFCGLQHRTIYVRVLTLWQNMLPPSPGWKYDEHIIAVCRYSARKVTFCSLTKQISFSRWLDSPSGPRPSHCWGFSYTRWDTSHSVELLWTTDRPVAGTATYTTHDTLKRLISMLPAGFEPAFPASERPQSHALDPAANGSGPRKHNKTKNSPN